ncbi:oligosaccharide flippase family protein [soil metagenome]
MSARKFLNDASIYLFGQLLNRGIGFFLLPLYTRYLTTSDYGILSVAGTLSLIFGMLAGLSLDASLYILYFKLSEDDFKSLLLHVWMVLLFFPLLILGLLEIAGASGAANIFPDVPWSPYLRLAAWIAYLQLFSTVLINVYRAKQQALNSTLVSVIMFVLQTLFIMYFVIIRQGGAEGSLQGQFISMAIIAICSNIILLRWTRPWKFSKAGRENLRVAFFLAIGYLPHIFSMWLLNVSDRWILATYSIAISEIGIYSLAFTIGSLVLLGGTSMISAYAPIYFKNAGDPKFRGTLQKLLAGYVTIHTITALAISLFAVELLRIMTTSGFHQAAFYVPFIALGYWFSVAIYQVCLTVIENAQRTKLIPLLTVPPAIFSIVSNLLFVPKYGILATAVNILIVYCMMAVLSVIVSRRIDRLPFSWLKIAQIFTIGIMTFWVGNEFLSFDSFFLAIAAKAALFGIAAFLMFTISGFRISDAKRLLKPA